jgi:hypothetical protein
MNVAVSQRLVIAKGSVIAYLGEEPIFGIVSADVVIEQIRMASDVGVKTRPLIIVRVIIPKRNPIPSCDLRAPGSKLRGDVGVIVIGQLITLD